MIPTRFRLKKCIVPKSHVGELYFLINRIILYFENILLAIEMMNSENYAEIKNAENIQDVPFENLKLMLLPVNPATKGNCLYLGNLNEKTGYIMVMLHPVYIVIIY